MGFSAGYLGPFSPLPKSIDDVCAQVVETETRIVGLQPQGRTLRTGYAMLLLYLNVHSFCNGAEPSMRRAFLLVTTCIVALGCNSKPDGLGGISALEPKDRQAASEVRGLGGSALSGDLGTVIDLNNSKVTDSTLGVVRKFPDLIVLRLNNTQVTDQGILQLDGLSHLKELELDSTRVTDPSLKFLRGFPNLGLLRLTRTAITDEGLTYLKGLSNLAVLDLQGTKITDKGVASLSRSAKVF